MRLSKLKPKSSATLNSRKQTSKQKTQFMKIMTQNMEWNILRPAQKCTEQKVWKKDETKK